MKFRLYKGMGLEGKIAIANLVLISIPLLAHLLIYIHGYDDIREHPWLGQRLDDIIAISIIVLSFPVGWIGQLLNSVGGQEHLIVAPIFLPLNAYFWGYFVAWITRRKSPAKHATQTTEPPQDEFCCLMRDDRGYWAPPNWQLTVSPRETSICINSQLRWILWIALLCFVIAASMAWAVYSLELDEGVKHFFKIGIWFSGIMGLGFVVVFFLYEKFRDKNPWLICKPLEKVVICPRLEKTFPIDQVQALQVVSGRVKREVCDGTYTTTYAQLNMIINENGKLERYPLIGAFSPSELTKPAEQISNHCNIPLRVDKVRETANWD